MNVPLALERKDCLDIRAMMPGRESLSTELLSQEGVKTAYLGHLVVAAFRMHVARDTTAAQIAVKRLLKDAMGFEAPVS